MLHRKQLCLARNSLGMLCQCQALSGGRCHFHSPLSARQPLARSLARRVRPLFASFEVWGDLFGGQYGDSVRRPSPRPTRALMPAAMRMALGA